MPAASRWCSTSRAYGRSVGHRIAIAASGVPARAASTIARTAWRTSSSASVTDTISVDGARLPAGRPRCGRPPSAARPIACEIAVGVAIAATAEQHRAPTRRRRARATSSTLERPERLRQEHDHARQRRSSWSARATVAMACVSRSPSSYQFAAEPLRRRAARRAATSRPRRDGRSSRSTRLGTGEAQLAVEVAQGDDGRRMLGDGVERGAVFAEHAAHGEVDDGGRHREPLLGAQRRPGQALGEPVERDEVDRGDTAQPPERAARRSHRRRWWARAR